MEARDILRACERGLPDDAARIEASVALAGAVLRASRAGESTTDRVRRALLARLTHDPAGQGFVAAVADRLHRSRSAARSASAVSALLTALDLPSFLPRPLRAPLALARADALPSALVVSGVRGGIRVGAHGLLHDAHGDAPKRLVARRAAESTTVNVNLVGEVVLGEREAEARAEAYLGLVRDGDARAVSIKLSSIASQLSLSAFDASLDALTPRLARICAAARARSPHVLVNLDMEAFDDLELTLAVHDRLAADPALADLTLGVVLQAYLPDAHVRYEALLSAAQARVAAGGAPLRVRLVKGANLSMERHLATVRGHPLPVYGSKPETDASWLALVDRALAPANARVLHVGVASHNLFGLAFALVLRAERAVAPYVDLEMLEGMADAERRTLAALGGSMLVYAPIAPPDTFDAAIAYLVRRLEEATAKDHFLPASFRMSPGDAAFAHERARHVGAARGRLAVTTASRRAAPRPLVRSALDAPFANEPDTDFAVAAQRRSISDAVAALRHAPVPDVASRVAGARSDAPDDVGFDPSRPGHAAYAIRWGDTAIADAALHSATLADWPRVSPRERAERLLDVAHALRRARGALVATMVLDAGKRITEADAEVSEAIDFAEYYARTALTLFADRSVRASPRGVVLIASPWNFPLAIGAGGALAALAAGNRVLLKPSPKTPRVAHVFVELAHGAGIPEDALALLVLRDDVADRVVRDPRLDAVVLTGSTRTARAIRAARPTLPLFAETGGKNATIVTASADRDVAIRDVVASAFGHAGQKCSATSLLVCEREVYEDASFVARLVDATTSLPVGSAWDPRSVVTPLVEPPSGALARALETLEPGESWLVPPARDPDNPRLVSPGIKRGVARGGFTHTTELFGPVLAMMPAASLDDAIAVANATPYGLTGAIQSLDAREIERFLVHVEIGNAYVNRGTTGAIVRRQPFGGTKASCFGPGAKAGGPDYVRQLARLEDAELPTQTAAPNDAVRARLHRAASAVDRRALEALEALGRADAACFARTLRDPVDPSAIPTQRNLFARVPRAHTALLVTDDDPSFEVLRALIAADACGARPAIVLYGSAKRPFVHTLADELVLLPQRPSEVSSRLVALGLRTLRALCAPSDGLAAAAAAADVTLLHVTATRSPRDALCAWLEERSLTIEDHRYGQPLPEALRARFPPREPDTALTS